MKNNLLLLFILLFEVMQTSSCLAQDIHFSQYYYSPLTLNPALTAANSTLQATIQYKQQWKTVDGYRTTSATFEMKANQSKWNKSSDATDVYEKKSGKGLAFGINIFSDKAGGGSLKQNQGNLSVAYHALLTRKNKLSAGIIGGITQLTINTADLRWNNQYLYGSYDASLGSGEIFPISSIIYYDFGAGVLWSHNKPTTNLSSNNQSEFNIGLSAFHINQPRVSFYKNGNAKLYRRYTLHANWIHGIRNTNFSLGASALIMNQSSLLENTTGILVKYNLIENSKYTGNKQTAAFYLGCYYRFRDAVIPYLLLEKNRFAFGISYDINASGLSIATLGRGGVEVTLRFNNNATYLYKKSKGRFGK